MRHYMMDGFWGHGWSMGFGWIFWIIIILLVVWAVGRLTSHGKQSRENSALDILKERYARGEITRTEFTEFKKDIS